MQSANEISEGTEVQANRAWLSAVVVAGGLLMTWAIASWVERDHRQETRRAFDLLADRVRERVYDGVRSLERELRSAAAMVTARPEVSSSEWQIYVEAYLRELESHGVTGLAFVRQVFADDAASYLLRKHDEVGPEFEIREGEIAAAGPQLFVVEHIEPLMANVQLRGVDLATIGATNEAAQLARDSGAVTISEVAAANALPTKTLSSGSQRRTLVNPRPPYSGGNCPASSASSSTEFTPSL